MKKQLGVFGRSVSLLLIIFVLSSMAFGSYSTVEAAEVKKNEKSHDIAIAYDNSGSMYFDIKNPKNGNKAWCRAKYAMEIFASMIDYNNDKLHIFPMGEVTTDGPNGNVSSYPIEIQSKEDIDKITNMYSLDNYETPYAPVKDAYEYLSNSRADEKWLIVLTDGAFNYYKYDKNNKEANRIGEEFDLKKELSSLTSKEKNIKVQYLGLGAAINIKADEDNFLYAKKSSDESLKKDLIEICNRIFQRRELKTLNGNTLNLELSMKTLIVFVQGKGAKINSLTDSSGNVVQPILDSGQRTYSKISYKHGNDLPDALPDETLAGQVVTFGNCKKGDYTLSVTGAEKDKIQIFYEPDVDIDVVIKNNDGKRIENPSDFVAGEYTIESKIIDAATKEDVSSHPLIGKNELKTKVKTSKDAEFKEYDNGAEISFIPDDKGTTIKIEGNYLDGEYEISSENDEKLSWLLDLKIQVPPVQIGIKASVLQKDSWYVLKEHETWEPIRVNLTITTKDRKGDKLNDEELSKVVLKIDEISDRLKYNPEPIPGESAINVWIAQDENGQYIEPETGSYKIKMHATYTDESGNPAESYSDDVKIEIQENSLLMHRLIIVGICLLILLILAVITIILHKIKVFPNGIEAANGVYKKGGRVSGSASAVLSVNSKNLFKKTGSISVRSTKGSMAVSLSVEAVHPLFRWLYVFQKSSRRRYRITGISASNMEYVKVNGTEYKKDTFSEINEVCSDLTPIEFSKMSGGVRYIVSADLENK